jgi:hypothetical protein
MNKYKKIGVKVGSLRKGFGDGDSGFRVEVYKNTRTVYWWYTVLFFFTLYWIIYL